jgi:hypothetical protein
MQGLPGGRGLCGTAVKVGKALADPQLHVHVEDCEKIISLKLPHVLFLAQRDRRRAEIGTLKMTFKVWQDRLQMGEHAPIWVMEGKGKGGTHFDRSQG